MKIDTFPQIFDRADWLEGPWDGEPDRVQWSDELTGLPLLARRGSPHSGSWCGYAAVPPGHPLHGKSYGECINTPPCGAEYCEHTVDNILNVHGGITFAAECFDDEDGSGVCHVPEPGEPDDVWWFGFDCGHFGDLSPGMEALDRRMAREIPDWPKRSEGLYSSCTYRDLDYVRHECRELAQQLLELS